MKTAAFLGVSLGLIAFGCLHRSRTSPDGFSPKNRDVVLDPAFKDTVLRHITARSGKPFASFETPAELRFFLEGRVVDSIMDTDFHMISWYSSEHDTIDLVAHVADMETQALLIRFLHGKVTPYYLRAPHLGQKYFRLSEKDSFSNIVEVPLVSYQLRLSAIPDTIQKPLVFGSIDMESAAYYDRRDSGKTSKVRMKFYFVSQFRHFDFLR